MDKRVLATVQAKFDHVPPGLVQAIIEAYDAALQVGPVAWRWRSNFGKGWMPWASGQAPDDTNATPEAKAFWKDHERQEQEIIEVSGGSKLP